MNTQTGYAHGDAVRTTVIDAVNTITSIKLDDVAQTAQNTWSYTTGFFSGLMSGLNTVPPKSVR